MSLKLQYLFCLCFIAVCSSKPRRCVIPRRIEDEEKPKSFEPDIPEHCQNLTICGDVSNYPQEYINQLIRENSMMPNATLQILGGYEDAKCVQRDHAPNDIDLCKSETKPIQAKAGKDSNGRWHFLVGEHWLCVELCQNAGDHCSKEVYVYTGYSTICLQKHTTKRTVAVDTKGNVILIDLTIPSSCCCHVRQTR